MEDKTNIAKSKDIYKVESVVCDYGIYEKEKLLLILNSRANAILIADILEADRKHERYTK